jgi:hypothetical protein
VLFSVKQDKIIIRFTRKKNGSTLTRRFPGREVCSTERSGEKVEMGWKSLLISMVLLLIFLLCFASPSGAPKRVPDASTKEEQDRLQELQKKQKQWLKGDEKQQDRILAAVESLRDAHIAGLEMEKKSRISGVDCEELIKQREILRKKWGEFLENHVLFVEDLSNGQQQWWQATFRKMAGLRERIDALMQQLNQETEKRRPLNEETTRVSHEIQSLLWEWQQSYKQIASDMDVRY